MSHAYYFGWRNSGYIVPLGASTPLTTLGFVQGALELQQQIASGILAPPRIIYLPFATGGSVAGLLIGLTLMNMKTRVVAVQTVETLIANRKKLERLIKRTLALLRVGKGHFRRCLDHLEIVDRQHLGGGYGDIPSHVKDAVTLAAGHGLDLEPVHSGKAFAALLNGLPQFPNGELLFWNTHDQNSDAIKWRNNQ